MPFDGRKGGEAALRVRRCCCGSAAVTPVTVTSATVTLVAAVYGVAERKAETGGEWCEGRQAGRQAGRQVERGEKF